MTNKILSSAENIAIRIAKRQAASRKKQQKIIEYYNQKPPKAPEQHYHSTEITKHYE